MELHLVGELALNLLQYFETSRYANLLPMHQKTYNNMRTAYKLKSVCYPGSCPPDFFQTAADWLDQVERIPRRDRSDFSSDLSQGRFKGPTNWLSAVVEFWPWTYSKVEYLTAKTLRFCRQARERERVKLPNSLATNEETVLVSNLGEHY